MAEPKKKGEKWAALVERMKNTPCPDEPMLMCRNAPPALIRTILTRNALKKLNEFGLAAITLADFAKARLGVKIWYGKKGWGCKILSQEGKILGRKTGARSARSAVTKASSRALKGLEHDPGIAT